MATLYVTDLDGTLLNDEARVTAHSASIISDLTHRGAMVTVATARTPATVEPLLARTFTRLPAVVMTGAAWWNRREGRYMAPQFIDAKVQQAVRLAAAEFGVNPFVYTLGPDDMLTVYHNGARNTKEQRFIDERMSMRYKRFHLDEPGGMEPVIDNTILYFAMGPRERVFALAEHLRATVDCSVSNYVDIFGKETGLLEVFAPGVSKAAAVKALAHRTGADRVVVFGDNLNDLPMMAVADVAVAVDNALPEVKEAADVVIGRNTADSVARFMLDDFNHRQ